MAASCPLCRLSCLSLRLLRGAVLQRKRDSSVDGPLIRPGLRLGLRLLLPLGEPRVFVTVGGRGVLGGCALTAPWMSLNAGAVSALHLVNPDSVVK